MVGETHEARRGLRSDGLRARLARQDLARLYGLFAVLVVASVQLFFSLQKGGFFPAQWFWGVAVIAAVLFGAALVPGYLSSPSVGRKQWALAGALLLLTVVVAASVLWSISPGLSILEASRTAMYVGVFVLLLPAAAKWGSLIVDATIFGAILPPALYGLAQKILPTVVEYTGIDVLETDARASSTVGYHSTLGMMCAMGALLVVARVGSFRSVPLRVAYSATGVLFLVALYFSFSRGALVALAAGAVVLLVLAKRRFEVLGNIAIVTLPSIWVVLQARDYPGLVARPMSVEAIEADGLALAQILLAGVLLALITQALYTLLIRAGERYLSEGMRRSLKATATVLAASMMAWALFLGWNALQQAGGYDELKSRVTSVDSELETQAQAEDRTQRLASLSAAGRIGLWEIAWENWREHPFTGTGGDTFQLVFDDYGSEDLGDVLHPHSIWMSLLSDTGIFAFLAFAAFSVGCLAVACSNAFSKKRSRRSRALLAGCAAASTTYLVSSSIDWNWYIPASTLPFFALAAVAVGMTRRHKQESATPARY